MNLSHFLSRVIRPIRALLLVFTCTLLIFTSALPAFAFGGNTRDNDAPFAMGDRTGSDVTKGEEHLDATFEESENILKKAPGSMNVQQRAQKGPNEVQADADIEKMNRPSNSQDAFSFEDKVEQALEKITPGK